MAPSSFTTVAALLAAVLLLSLVSCRDKQSAPPTAQPAVAEHALATVNGRPITEESFLAELAKRGGSRHGGSGEKQSLLAELIRSEILVEAAKAAGYDQDPRVVAAFKRAMVSRLREDLLEPKLAQIQVTDEDISTYYGAHAAEFSTPDRVRAAVIQITVPRNASDEGKSRLLQRAETARAEALALKPATRSFGSLAVKYSDDQISRYRGGNTGWLEAGEKSRWPDEVIRTLSALSEPGEVSPIITTARGHYLAKLMEIEEGSTLPLDQVRDRIRHELFKKKKAQVEGAFYEELRAKIPVTVNEERLAAVSVPDSSTANESRKPPAFPGK